MTSNFQHDFQSAWIFSKKIEMAGFSANFLKREQS